MLKGKNITTTRIPSKLIKFIKRTLEDSSKSSFRGQHEREILS